MEKVMQGVTEFGFNLYQQLAKEDGNIFFSPYSISSALAIAYIGAKDETREQMAKVMCYTPEAPEIIAALMEFGNALNTEDGKIRTDVANAIWINNGFKLHAEFLDAVKDISEAVKEVDFVSASEEARVEINNWVLEKTQNLIKDLIPEGVLDAVTRSVIVNALYFKGMWSKEFDKKQTYEGEFANLDGTKTQVSFMNKYDKEFLYYKDDACQAVALTHGDGTTAHLIVLPNNFAGFEKAFDAKYFEKIVSMLRKTKLATFRLPAHKLECSVNLKGVLSEMGMPIVFSNAANFSGMVANDEDKLKIGEVIHKALCKVNEEGTEVAAATAVVMKCLGAMDPTMIVDRSFFSVVCDYKHHAPIGMGRVVKL